MTMTVHCIGTPSVGQSADGRLEVFVRGIDIDGGNSRGGLYHRWQQTPEGDWSSWYPHGGNLVGDPVVARNSEARLELFAVVEDGLAQKWQTARNNGWSDWHFAGRPLTLPFDPHLAIGRNADGRLEVFALAWDGHGQIALYHLWQLQPSRGWSMVTLLDVLPVSTWDPVFPVVGNSADGRLELFVIAAGTVYHKWQIVANTVDRWSGWYSHGDIETAPGQPPTGPAIASNVDGRLEFFVVAGAGSAQGTLQHIWQLAPNDGWSPPWHTEDGMFLDPRIGPTAARRADGRLEVCVVGHAAGADGMMWHKEQVSANNGWSDWSLLTQSTSVRFDQPGTQPSLTADGDGLDIFAVGKDGALWHAHWSSNDDAWSNWIPLGKPVVIDPDDFPLAWYDRAQTATPGKPQLMANDGDNLILLYYRGQAPFSDLTNYLDAVRAAGLRAMVEIAPLYVEIGQVPPTFVQGGTQGLIDYLRALKDRPEIWAWYLFDEPNPTVVPIDVANTYYKTIKAEDPNRLVAMVFGDGQPNLYRDAMDVYMFDYYPSFGAVEFDGLGGDQYFRVMLQHASNAAGKRAYWPVLKAVKNGDRFPTFAEERYMAYASIQAGGTGLFFWIHYAAEQWWSDTVAAPVMLDVGRYARALGHGALLQAASASATYTSATVYPDPDQHRLLLLLLHHGMGAVTTTITLDSALHVTTVTAPDEGDRSLQVVDGAFSDTLGPYEVRIYTLR